MLSFSDIANKILTKTRLSDGQSDERSVILKTYLLKAKAF